MPSPRTDALRVKTEGEREREIDGDGKELNEKWTLRGLRALSTGFGSGQDKAHFQFETGN